MNPKYNSDKQSFKKPTRLECMMQDYPKLLDENALVGFSQFQRWTSFSAVKNALADGAEKQKGGNAAEVAATGETDMYTWPYRVLKQAGVDIAEPIEVHYRNIKVQQPPKVVLHPSVGSTQQQIIQHFPGKANVHIHKGATLVVEGDVNFDALDLDGTLIIKAVSGAKVKVDNLHVKNAGWQFVVVKNDAQVEQKYAVRGYVLNKKGEQQYLFSKPGEYVLDDTTQIQYQAEA